MRSKEKEEKKEASEFRKQFQSTFSSLVGTMRNDNKLQAIEALSRYEEKYELALAEGKEALLPIYRDKIQRITIEIRRMESIDECVAGVENMSPINNGPNTDEN